MLQLIKQVLKSFKNSILLLFGLVFIAFSIVFASTSAIYFSSNILNSYNTLSDKSNPEDAITPLNEDSLNNNNYLNSIYDLDIDLSSATSSDILSPKDGKYFTNETDYRNYKTSFMYQPAKLSYLNFPYTSGKNNYLFPYYVASSDGKSNNNPYFTAEGINDPKTMYSTRARGILKSYSNVDIPTDSTKWRAWGILFRNDPRDIAYKVDPFTGLTVAPDVHGMVESQGYFSNGLFEKTMFVKGGNLKYPQSVQKYTDSNSVTSGIYQYYVNNNSSNEDVASPFFVSTTKLEPDINFDLSQFGSTTLESIQKILEMIKNGADAFNVLSSLSINTDTYLPLGHLDWNLINIDNLSEFIKIIHNPLYLTKSSTSSFVSTTDSKEQANYDQNSYIFNVHLDESKLTKLQKETLNYIEQNYPSKYDDLTRFVYSLKASQIKQEMLSEAGKDKEIEINKLNFDNLSDLNKEIILSTSTDGETTKISGVEVINNWISKYANEQQKTFFEKIDTYEKEYLSTLLAKDDSLAFNIQKSTTITDSATSNKILVSQKDAPEYKWMSPDVNNLYVSKGILLENSTKYLDVMDSLLTPTNIPSNKLPANSIGFSLNSNGDYLINLIRLISKSDIIGITKDDAEYVRAKELSNQIIKDYDTVGAIDPNMYYYVLSILAPKLSDNNQDLFLTSNQNITMNIVVKNGVSSITYNGSIEYATPYGYASIVTEKWLDDNNKSIIPVDEWKKAINMSSPDFFNWIKYELDDKYKITINSRTFVIIGVGQSIENSFPIVSLDKPIPNSKTESLVFVNKQGYDSIVATNPSIYQDEYFATRFLNKKIINDKNLSNINDIFNGLLSKKTYLASDTTNNKNLLTLRYSYPKIINSYVTIFAIVFMILLILIGIYLSYLMIKIYVDKNQVSLAIMKANGFSSWKIIFALSIFGLFIAILAGSLGYITTYFMQPLLLGVISDYWYLPISTHNFSFIGFIGGGISIYLSFAFFVMIGVFLLFKNPINNLITKNTDFKINKFLYILKSSKIKMTPLSKFTTSLIFNKIGKFSLFITLCSLGVSIISIAVSTSTKFNTSQVNTQDNRQYSYRFDLTTPTEQSGLYKIQEYKDFGITNDEIGLPSINETIPNSYDWVVKNPYRELWTKMPSDGDDGNNRDLFALRNLDGSIKEYGANKEKRYWGNIIIPSYAANSLIKEDVNFLRNAVFTKWLLDFDIHVVSFSLNAWDFVKSTLSQELVARIETISNDFVNKILEVPELKKANDIGSGTEDNPKPFLTLQNGIYKVDSDNVITNIDVSNLYSIRLNNQFMKFIGMVYGDDELSEADTKITYGILPKSDDIETYTYLDGTINNSDKSIPPIYNNGNNKLVDIKKEILGINLNSSFVTLVDNKGNNLNQLLTNKTNDGYYPVIINQGAKLKYKMNVGTTFDYTPTNSYDRYSKKLYNDNSSPSYSFKVVGISSDAFDVAFYTSQNFANEILKMNFDQGATIVKNYLRTDKNVYKMELIGDPNLIDNTTTSYPVSVTDYKDIVNNYGYVPFNGLFSREKDPILLSALSLESLSGMWGNYNSFSNSSFDNIANVTKPFIIFNSIVPYEKNRVLKLRNYLMSNDYKDGKYKNFTTTSDPRNDVINIFIKEYSQTNDVLRSYLDEIFGKNSLTISINNFEFFNSIFSTYSTIFNTFIVIQNLVITILVPIIIIIVMIISSVMINEFKRMFMILKTLGYKDSTNLKIIYITFVPVLIISLLVGMGLLFILLASLQAIIFNLASIYLSASIDWLPYIYGAIAIVAIMLLNFVYISIYMRKQNLRNTINNG